MNDVIIGVTVGTSISPEKIKEIAGNADPSAEEQKIIAALLKYLEENPPKVTESDPTVPDWAKEETKPSYSKSEVGLGNVDNVRQYSASNPPPYPVASVNGQTGKVQLGAADVGARPFSWMPTAQEVGALPATYVPPDQTAAQVGADPAGTATAAVSTHNTSTDSHGDLRLELKAISDRLTAFFDSDNQTLDELSEIVAYITSNKALIDSITTSKVSVTDIINNLTTNVANKPLSAAQGVALKGLIDAVSNSLSNYQPKGDYALASAIPTKVSQLQNDKGYLTEHQDISGKLDADKLPEAVNAALAQAKDSGEFDGDPGAPGVTPHIGSNGNWYIGSADTGVKAQGKDGTSVTVKSVSESTADGGSNVVEFTDGKTLTVKNGKQGSAGKTPIRGVDYYTEADKAEFSEYIASELAKRGQLKPEFANSIEECTDTTKLYVLPDGFIYAYMRTTEVGGPAYTNMLPKATDTDRITIYGGDYNGDGVNDGYIADNRLSSSGALTAQAGMSVSGFIPAKEGDILRVKGLTGMASKAAYVISYDSSNTKVNYKAFAQDGATIITPGAGFMSVADDGTITFPLASTYFGEGFDAIRFSGVFDSTAIVTVNEEINDSGGTVIVEKWASTGHAFVPADYDGEIADLRNIANAHTAEISALKKAIGTGTSENPLELIKNWDAPIYDANIPVFELSAEKPAMTDAIQTPDALYALYDALMEKYPHYITKTDLGVCSDGVNHVYRYDFCEPEQRCYHSRVSETKAKAILMSGIHYEWAGMYGLYYALEEIAENPTLRDLKRNVHLIVIPCSNPFVTLYENNEVSFGQHNANGVEIHQNFEVGFLYPGDDGYVEPGTIHHGGTEPLSEVETQYLDTVMKQNTDAAFFLTCHNFNADSYYGISFIWPSVATAYMCNMGYRLIDKMSNAWMDKYGDELAPGIASYRTADLESWDTRLGYAQISINNGTETRQATKYGIQAANVEICERFHVHGTKENPEPKLSSFTMSRGAEVYVNFLLTAFGVYDPKDKKEYSV